MNASEHLTNAQLAAFNTGKVAERESLEIGRHLLGCVSCRGLLPLPTPNEFWTAVMSERDSDQSRLTDRTAFSLQSYFRPFGDLFNKPGGLVWSGGALVVILSLTLLILFTVSKESGVESDVAKSFEIENPIPRPSYNQNEEPRIMLPHHSESGDRQRKPSAGISADQKLLEWSEPRPKQSTKTDHNNSGTARGVDANISSTRGAMSKCGAERTFEMRLGSDESDLVLKWESVPDATKYHLYVSDDDEILIDEFETAKGTSYVLKKPLDPNKAYKWKIIITLENGQTLNVDAQKFSAKDFLSIQDGSRSKRSKAVPRCLISQ